MFIHNNFEVVEFDFVTRNKSCSGKIQLLMSTGSGLFFDGRVNFDKISLQLCSTGNGFSLDGKPINTNAELRDNIFGRLNLKQVIRPRKDSIEYNIKDIPKLGKELSIEEINVFNNGINSSDYKSTFKNMAAVLWGSNPSGELLNPNAAQFTEKLKGYNFSILLSEVIEKDGYYCRRGKHNDEAGNSALLQDKISLEKGILLYPDISKYFNELQNPQYDKVIFKKIEREVNIYACKINNINLLAKHEGSKYCKRIKKLYGEGKKNAGMEIFGREISLGYERAHIYPRSLIKKLAMKQENDIDIIKILSMISDESNFLPLDATTHRMYDNDGFILGMSNGKLLIKDESAKDNKNIFNYEQITESYLQKCKKYLNMYKEVYDLRMRNNIVY